MTLSGIVTNPTGTLGGISFADLIECFCRMDPAGYGYQDLLLLSNLGPDPEGQYGDSAARYLANQRVVGEKWLTGTMIAMRQDMDMAKTCPSPPVGLRFAPEVAQTHTVPDPVTGEQVVAVFSVKSVSCLHEKNCRQNRTDPTGGWIEYTRYDGLDVPEADRRVEGAYDLTKGSERVTGTFSAPRIYAAAAGTLTCLPR